MTSQVEPSYNPWETAASLLSGKPRALPDQGTTNEYSGWKVAYLLSPTECTFRGLAFGSYTLDAPARCECNPEHLPPVLGCECGFHILHDRDHALSLLHRRRGLLLLHVELYGTIVIHRHGARGAEQAVTALTLSPTCRSYLCRRPTTGLRPLKARWVEACVTHLATGLTLPQLREQLQLDISLR